MAVLLLMAGAALLTAGAEAFAENVAPASARLGVSVLALGVLLAGAEPEEAITAALASGQGHPALAVGDAIGANLVILTLTLGLAALLTRLPVGRRALEYAVAAAVLGALTTAAAAQRRARPARGPAAHRAVRRRGRRGLAARAAAAADR